jgi:hypothetical protein
LACRPLLLMLLLALPLGAAQAVACIQGEPAEELRYKVSYQGVLSLGERLEIAQVTLRRESWAGAGEGPLLRSTLEVTTQGYPRVEAIYPLRLDYRSWFDAGCANTRMVELWRRAPDPSHQLLWIDQGVVQRFKKKPGKKAAALPVLLRSAVADQGTGFAGGGEVRFDAGQAVLDRLTLLQRLRSLELRPGQSQEFNVSDGKKLRGYRVVMEGREAAGTDPLIAGSLRLRLEARGVDGEEPATLVWLRDDAARTPLRFLSARPFGNFDVRLEDAGLPGQPH